MVPPTILISVPGNFFVTIEQDGMKPLLDLNWNETVRIEAHGSCEGVTKSLCGISNNDPSDDFAYTDR